jgi:hypothetical protein
MNHEKFSRIDASEGSSNRSFGLVFAALFLGVAISPLLSDASPRYWSFAAAGAFLLASMLKPSILTWPNRCWILFGRVLHKIVNPVVLAILFFLIITPYAVLIRMLRNDPLGVDRDLTADSYWKNRRDKLQNMMHQF